MSSWRQPVAGSCSSPLQRVCVCTRSSSGTVLLPLPFSKILQPSSAVLAGQCQPVTPQRPAQCSSSACVCSLARRLREERAWVSWDRLGSSRWDVCLGAIPSSPSAFHSPPTLDCRFLTSILLAGHFALQRLLLGFGWHLPALHPPLIQ